MNPYLLHRRKAFRQTGDPFWANVVLLLPFDGVSGSTSFIDYSQSPKTIAVSGNTQISTARSRFGGSSALFDGTDDFLSAPSSIDFAFGTNDFTVESWVYFTADGNRGVWQNGTDNLNLQRWNGNLQAWDGTTRSSTTAVSLNNWHHVAFARSSGTARVFFNGVQAIAWTSTVNYSSTSFILGYTGNGLFDFQGYVDDLRITKGIARYTTNFTPPTAPFPTGP